MRILVLNANTTDFVTQTAADDGRRVASPGTEIAPVVDGMRCAVPQAEKLVRLGLRKPATGSCAPPGERQTSALDPALATFLPKR